MGSVDACLAFDSTRTPSEGDSGAFVYLFVGARYFTFANKKLVTDSRPIAEDWGLPSNIDAAFQWSRNGRIYFIKSTACCAL